MPPPAKISFANLDGSGGGGGDLNTTGATVNLMEGVALDPAAGKIYWANLGTNDPSTQTISFANLDGSGGGGDLNTTGATVNHPDGVALDPAAGKIYWANGAGDKISFANLSGSGGGDLFTGVATVNVPAGVAVDRAAGRIYWANQDGNKISFANLDGSGGGDLNTAGATVNAPIGVALDPAAGKIYWANESTAANKISFANLDGSGGGDLIIAGAAVSNPTFPVLLKSPSGAAVPALTGSPSLGSTLGCSQGSWAGDLVGALLYQAPQSFSYQWNLGGIPIPGATRSSYATSSTGYYTCTVTASNHAGSTSQTSAPFLNGSPPSALITTPAVAAIYTLGQVVDAGYSCAEATGGPGIQSCSGPVPDGAAIDTSHTGSFTFTVTATSTDGLSATATSDYTVSSNGVIVPNVLRCPRATGRLSGRTLGLIKLGMTRAQARKAYTHSSNRGKRYEGFFCLTPVGIRVGYASPKLLSALPRHGRAQLDGRVVWVSTANSYFSVTGVRRGASITSAAKHLKLGRPFQIGANDWYLAPDGASTAVLKVRHGVVQEIGIADKQITQGRPAQHMFLTSFS
jgi:hypothetical protein